MANQDDGPDRLKLTITGLIPDKEYALQVRAYNENGHGPWSTKFNFRTVDDKNKGGGGKGKGPNKGEGNNKPRKVFGVIWEARDGGFYAQWNASIKDTDGDTIVVKQYEIEIARQVTPNYWNAREYVVLPNGDETLSKTFGPEELRAIFGVTPGTLRFRIRVVNSVGNRSEWSDAHMASMGKPAPPTDAVVVPIPDGLDISWTAPVDMAHVIGYRVYVDRFNEVFEANKANMVYEGSATTAGSIITGQYQRHYIKIRSYSAFNVESDDLLASGVPINPFLLDETPPNVPHNFTVSSIDRSNRPATVVASWEHDSADPANDGTQNYYIQYGQVVNGVVDEWMMVSGTTDTRRITIPLPRAYANYHFQIRVNDRNGNWSEWSSPPVLVQGSIPGPPPKVSNLTGVGSIVGLALRWDLSPHDDVTDGGKFELEVAKDAGFSTGLLKYTLGGATTTLDISGLQAATTHYVRVRAIDTDNEKGAWSDTLTIATTAFPVAELSDGLAVETSPAASATGGLGYIAVSWPRVENVDSVTYELHMSNSPTFVPTFGSATTLVTTTSSTSTLVTRTPDGTPLLSTNDYYFRVIAFDRDSTTAVPTPLPPPDPGPVSTAARPKLIGPSDLGIGGGGENLFFNSSFDEDSDGDGVANYWQVYNAPSTVPLAPSLVTGRVAGMAQRLVWENPSTANKGITSTTEGKVVTPNTEYVLSFYARASAGTGFKLAFSNAPATGTLNWFFNPTPSATTWQRYVVGFKTGATVDPKNVAIVIDGHSDAAGWMEIDDAQMEAGNVATAYKTGTVSIAKLATGKLSTAVMTIAEDGVIQSEDFNAATRTGFALNSQGLYLYDGEVDAATLKSNTAIIGDLRVQSTLTIEGGGHLRSANYKPIGDTEFPTGRGFDLSETGLDIYSGTIAVGTLVGGTISATTIRLGVNGQIIVDPSGTIQSSNYQGLTSGWRLAQASLEIYNGIVAAGVIKSGKIETATIVMGNQGSMRSENWVMDMPGMAAGNGWGIGYMPYQFNQSGGLDYRYEIQMMQGVIKGATIVSNQFSSGVIDPAFPGQYTFSVTSTGRLRTVGLYVYGDATVGWGSQNFLQSGLYNPGSSGWRIDGDGRAELNSIWMGTVGAGRIHLTNQGGIGPARIMFYPGGVDTPADAHFIGVIDAGRFDVRGAQGAAIEMYARNMNWAGAWYASLVGGGSVIRLSQNVHITSKLFVDNSVTLANGGLAINNGGFGQAGGRFQVWHDDVWLSLGAAQDPGNFNWDVRMRSNPTDGKIAVVNASSRELKKDIRPSQWDYKQLLKLEPKDFKWKAGDESQNYDIGFISEEARDLGLWKWVIDDTANGMPLGFNYNAWTVANHIVNRGQQEEIDQLHSEVAELRALVENLIESRA